MFILEIAISLFTECEGVADYLEGFDNERECC